MVDDGAVFYLNGQEIYRQNLPAGPIDATTPASSEIGRHRRDRADCACRHGACKSGQNVLAIEVHKSGDAVNDALLVGRS